MSEIAHPHIEKYCAGEITAADAAQEIDNAIKKYIAESN